MATPLRKRFQLQLPSLKTQIGSTSSWKLFVVGWAWPAAKHPHRCALTFRHPRGDWKEEKQENSWVKIRTAKIGKGERRREKKKNQRKGNHLPSHIGRPIAIWSLKNGHFGNNNNNKTTPLLFPWPYLLLQSMSYVVFLSPPKFLATPCLLGADWETESLDTVHMVFSWNIGVLSTLFEAQIQNKKHTSCCEES